ncbi:MAG: ion transporter [Bacteroidales bacterium]|nr:ion transporter [Bacteroidales bacterium]
MIALTPYQKLEKAMYYLVDEKDENNKLSKGFNYFLMMLIILSVGEMALETDDEIFVPYRFYFNLFDTFTVIVFSVEYFIRIMTAHLNPETKGKTRWESIRSYIFSFAGIIDLVSILPFYLNYTNLDLRVLRMLRLMRFLRVFKITRYNDSMKLVVDVIKDKSSEIGVIMGLIVIIMIISSFVMFYAEHDAQPEAFPNVLGCMWWAVVTMTTIGYGDVYPITVVGKIVGSTMAMLGIGLVAMPTGIISAGFLEKVNEKKEKKNAESEEKQEHEHHLETAASDQNASDGDQKHYCPYCGHRLD